jgi:hypothetical protein
VANHFDVEELLEALNVLLSLDVQEGRQTSVVPELKKDQCRLAGSSAMYPGSPVDEQNDKQLALRLYA